MFNHKLLLKPALAGLVIGAGLVTSAYAIGLERQDAAVLRGTPQGEPTQQAAVIPAPPAATSNHAAPQSEFPNAKVTIGPVVYVSATEHRAQPAPCTERWRALESGPVGRYVLDTCPGAPAPPPPPASEASSRLGRLPTLRQLSQGVATTRLVSPRNERTVTDAHTVVESLDRSAEANQPAPGSTVPDAPDPLAFFD